MNKNQSHAETTTGVSYNLVGDYYIPDLKLSEAENQTIGRFGRERLNYLKNHRRLVYINLLTTGKLNAHIREIEETANDRLYFVGKQIAEQECVTEKLKSDDPMLWVQKMNNIKNRAIEAIQEELIYA